ncbi:putative VPS10 domain-containing receptor SorCS3-like [Scophthalmus maximus]|uniref:Putative VPS10 domain-containing receptor SorCS3-like n=1 Tax=Scophthalmus maximus TaxID=52904 RepID=A0A2U9BPY6_SCOMX|nr:putative VPS10 domain-containing receptor SorCS3-like [Scophthalmus maximus]
METWAGSCPGLHLSLGIWVMIAALTPGNAKAEITCASCPSPVQLHLERLELGLRTGPTEEPSAPKFKELGVADQNAGVDEDQETGVASVEDLSPFPQDVSSDGVRTEGDTPGRSGESNRASVEEEREPLMGEGASALRRARRSGAEFAEFGQSRWTGRTGAEAGGAPEDGQKPGRSDLGWNRDEGRGNTRQDEPKIASSTFSLTGDSAHNHAVVYWSGQNSSVSRDPRIDRNLFLCVFGRFPAHGLFLPAARVHKLRAAQRRDFARRRAPRSCGGGVTVNRCTWKLQMRADALFQKCQALSCPICVIIKGEMCDSLK